MQEQKKEFTGVWIPRHIIEDEELSMTEKIIFAEIACFEVCYKSNESLGKRYSLKADTIVRIISKLVKKGYIERASFDGRNRQLIAKMDKPNPMQTRKKILPCLGKKSYADQEKNPTIDNTLENKEENNILQTDVCEVIPDLLKVTENRGYTELATTWQPNGNHLAPQVKLSKVKLSKVKLSEANLTTAEADGVKEIMDLFYTINPTLNFGNTTYRKAAQELIDQFGEEAAKGYVKASIAIYGKKYAPVITNPYILKNKLSELTSYYQREQSAITPIV